jgi:hypothetical protein
MRLWPSGITIYSTDEVWTARAWGHLTAHWQRHGTFHRPDVAARFARHRLEWKESAVTYLAANIRRHGL